MLLNIAYRKICCNKKEPEITFNVPETITYERDHFNALKWGALFFYRKRLKREKGNFYKMFSQKFQNQFIDLFNWVQASHPEYRIVQNNSSKYVSAKYCYVY